MARVRIEPLALDVAETFAALFDLPTELATRCMVEPNTGCVLWLGATNRGHGRVWVAAETPAGIVRVRWYVHVLAWICKRGPLPPGIVLDHRCRQRCCVNLDHLDPVTSGVNTLRGEGPSAVNARRDACGRCGAPYDYQRSGTRRARECRACMRARQRAYRERRANDGRA